MFISKWKCLGLDRNVLFAVFIAQILRNLNSQKKDRKPDTGNSSKYVVNTGNPQQETGNKVKELGTG
jgi:hypothetical protein